MRTSRLTLSIIIIAGLIIATLALPTWSTADEQVMRETLQNGLQVVVVRNKLAPVVTTEMNYLAGSIDSPPGFPGMAHAQEHMMFRGSPGLSQAQLASLIAALGGNADADTQESITQYFFTLPAADLEIALHIEAIRMQGVLDAQELWQKERGAIEQEVAQDISNPFYTFYEKLLADVFAGTPYAHSPLGTYASFQQTTGAMLKEFHEKWYAPNNAILVITGDIDPPKALQTAKNLFKDIPARKVPQRPEIKLQPLKPTRIELKTDMPYGLAIVAYRLPGYKDPDYAAGEILSDILSSQRSTLYELVTEGKSLMYDFQASIFPEAGLGFAMAAFPHGGSGEQLISELKSRIAAYVKQGFPPDLVQAAKLQTVTDMELTKNSISDLASEWSTALAQKGLRSPQEGIEHIKAVDAAQVSRVAEKYLNNDTAIIGILTPEASGQPIPLKGPRGKENFAPQQAQKVALPDWAKNAMELPDQPHSSISPTDMTLSNGVRLIVQTETVSPTVVLYGEVKHEPDLEIPEGQEGVSDILAELFPYGTESMDRLAFQKALDDIGAQGSVGLSFSLKTLDAHFDRGVELLADDLLHPALPESAFKVVQQETLSTVKGVLHSPDHLFGRAVKAGLYPKNDPTLRQPTPESISSLRLENVKQYYKKVFRPDLTTIIVIGNITPQKARTAIEKYFGAWHAAGPRPATKLPGVPSNKQSTTAVPDPTRVQDMVILAQTLGLTRSDPDYYTLQVGNHVLSGAFYATRLYRDLRQERGLVYMVESALEVRETRGAFEVIYACDPANVGQARGIIERDLRQMQNTPVSADELRQAQIILLRSIPLAEASTDNIASSLLNYSLLGLPLDEHLVAGRHYLATTAEQVRQAFAKYIRPGDLVQVSLGPPPK